MTYEIFGSKDQGSSIEVPSITIGFMLIYVLGYISLIDKFKSLIIDLMR